MMKIASHNITELYPFIPVRGNPPPPPTILYSLQPIGIGTQLVESLSSYFTRVVAAHMLPVSACVTHLFAQHMVNVRFTTNNMSIGAMAIAREMNGMNKVAADWVSAIEELTGQDGLKNLTMLPFDRLFSQYNLVSSYRKWCPHCLEEWKSSGTTIYEPLLWSQCLVKSCPVHGCSLQSHCQICNAANLLVAARTVPGYCSNCQNWLGQPLESGVAITPLDEPIGRLLAMGCSMEQYKGTIQVQELITYLIKTRVKMDGILSFSCLLKVGTSRVRKWLSGDQLPTIGELLCICSVFKLDLIEILTMLPEDFTQFEENVAAPVDCPTVRGSLPWAQIHALLHDVAKGKASLMQVSDIARVYKCQPMRLYKRYPDLCKEITARVRQSKHMQRQPAESSKPRTPDEVVDYFVCNNLKLTRRRLADLVGKRETWMYELVSRKLSDLRSSKTRWY